jgi:hypothetical protein
MFPGPPRIAPATTQQQEPRVPFTQANFADTETADDAANKFLRHALKVWANGRDVPDVDLPGLVSAVLDFADSSMRDARYGRGVSA